MGRESGSRKEKIFSYLRRSYVICLLEVNGCCGLAETEEEKSRLLGQEANGDVGFGS